MSHTEVAQRLAVHRVSECARDIDWLANQASSLMLRQELKEASNRLHRLARSLAREAEVIVYAEDDE